ncbi:hypothetical protein [Amycolatopsis sp. Hca4]|uniref:hypothetical protein n=1 Tax=Amycolatopsis sp. Hca4 TaxID=2742131 RepID=UPI001590F353|nr:hypothetical protein [Amycolatopsis sp. Hca4]QKV78058.1 hypothetical protein HUT10_32935 [Amycolatopsis sp. Hca4]
MQEAPRPLDVDELLRQLAALSESDNLDRQTVERVSTALSAAERTVRVLRTGVAGTSARQQAIDALSELGVPANPALIAEFHRARFGSELAPRALASIRRDEMRAYRAKSSTRSMWVVPALTTQLFPARGHLTLSTWPAWLRILGTRSARVDMLQVMIVLLDAIVEPLGPGSDVLQVTRELRRNRLTELLVRMGVGVPGIGQVVDQRTAREAIQEELGRITPKDRAEREDAAAALSTLSEEQQIFGRYSPTHSER